jgi:hypothetical protein
VEQGGLRALLGLCSSKDAALRELCAAALRCVALLSTADTLKPVLASAGALPALCAAAAPTGGLESGRVDAEWQRPAAAALANLCSEEDVAEDQIAGSGACMRALCQLAASPDREVQARSTSPSYSHWPCACTGHSSLTSRASRSSCMYMHSSLAAPAAAHATRL